MAKKSASKQSTGTHPIKTSPSPVRQKAKTPSLSQVLRQLESLSNASVRAQNAKGGVWGPGVTDNQFGVKHGDIRAMAKNIKADPELAKALWATGNIDAQFLAILLFKPSDLSARDLNQMARSIRFAWVGEWFINYLVKPHSEKESLRCKWMSDKDRWAARAGWSLTAERVANDPVGLDLPALLDRIEAEMAKAPPEVQWTMNHTLANIGIHCPNHRKRAVAIGEKLGLYRDHPVSKGCVSPYAPIWIHEMVRRKG